VKTTTPRETLEILLVEDNPGDVDLVLEILGESEIKNRISVVNDGVEAMAFLRREGRYSSAPVPHMVLLDLNIPRKDGREVLAEVKNDPALKQIPVLVLSSSEAERDLLNAYRLHANCFITKPVDLVEFFAVVRCIEQFWLTMVKLPPRTVSAGPTPPSS
jgi:two-component system, chemotaxis family, response regulator Rcp1